MKKNLIIIILSIVSILVLHFIVRLLCHIYLNDNSYVAIGSSLAIILVILFIDYLLLKDKKQE